MADRIWLSQVEGLLARFAELMGTETYSEAHRAGRPVTGTYTLHVQRLEGYRIRVEKLVNEQGGVTCPFGYTVRNAREMYEALRFGIDCTNERERNLIERPGLLAQIANESPGSVAANEALAGVTLD